MNLLLVLDICFNFKFNLSLQFFYSFQLLRYLGILRIHTFDIGLPDCSKHGIQVLKRVVQFEIKTNITTEWLIWTWIFSIKFCLFFYCQLYPQTTPIRNTVPPDYKHELVCIILFKKSSKSSSIELHEYGLILKALKMIITQLFASGFITHIGTYFSTSSQ